MGRQFQRDRCIWAHALRLLSGWRCGSLTSAYCNDGIHSNRLSETKTQAGLRQSGATNRHDNARPALPGHGATHPDIWGIPVTSCEQPPAWQRHRQSSHKLWMTAEIGREVGTGGRLSSFDDSVAQSWHAWWERWFW